MQVPCIFETIACNVTCTCPTLVLHMHCGGYACIPAVDYVYNRDQKIQNFVGVHQKGKSNKDVSCVVFKNVSMDFFPKGIMKLFPNLESLEMASCRLGSLTRQDLFHLRDLKSINLQLHDASSLPTDLFADISIKRAFLFGTFATKLLPSMIKRNKFRRIMFQKIYCELFRFDYYHSNRTSDGMDVRIYFNNGCTLKAVYNPSSLQSLCEDSVAKNLKRHNISEVLELGQIMNSEVLKDSAEIYIRRNFPEGNWDDKTLSNPQHVAANIEKSLKRRERTSCMNWFTDCFKCL